MRGCTRTPLKPRGAGGLNSLRQNGFFVTLGFVRFVGESRPTSRRYPYRVLREREPLAGII